jgi:hypothetical protein
LKISETRFITLMGATFPFIVYDRRRPAPRHRERAPRSAAAARLRAGSLSLRGDRCGSHYDPEDHHYDPAITARRTIQA